MPGFADLVRRRDEQMLRQGKRKRRLRLPPRMPWPAGIERDYARSLKAIIRDADAIMLPLALDALPRIFAEAAGARPTVDSVRADDYSDEIKKLRSLIETGFFGKYTDAALAALAEEIAQALSDNNRRALGRVFTTVLGVDVMQAEPWLQPEMRAFVTQNVDLIKSLARSNFDKVEQIIYQGARSGLRWEAVAAQLRDTPFKATRARAELIARDQVGKFNGQLSLLRQTQVGVTRYRWRGALDARERAEHVAREGVIFDWSNPPSDGHPGEPIQCRCYAEPVLEDIGDYFADAAGAL